LKKRAGHFVRHCEGKPIAQRGSPALLDWMEQHMITSIEELRGADWDQLEADVVARIRALRAICTTIKPGELSDKMANDLILPNLKLLAAFCEAMKVK
jgi:hypothetical protein